MFMPKTIKPVPVIILILTILNFFLVLLFVKSHLHPKDAIVVANDYSEIDFLSKNALSFSELKSYFTELAKNKGPQYAFKILKEAPMPPNIDMHLMGHVVGDVLY